MPAAERAKLLVTRHALLGVFIISRALQRMHQGLGWAGRLGNPWTAIKKRQKGDTLPLEDQNQAGCVLCKRFQSNKDAARCALPEKADSLVGLQTDMCVLQPMSGQPQSLPNPKIQKRTSSTSMHFATTYVPITRYMPHGLYDKYTCEFTLLIVRPVLIIPSTPCHPQRLPIFPPVLTAPVPLCWFVGLQTSLNEAYDDGASDVCLPFLLGSAFSCGETHSHKGHRICNQKRLEEEMWRAQGP